jgi:hypothetical protein
MLHHPARKTIMTIESTLLLLNQQSAAISHKLEEGQRTQDML